jgi:hypothetical protein
MFAVLIFCRAGIAQQNVSEARTFTAPPEHLRTAPKVQAKPAERTHDAVLTNSSQSDNFSVILPKFEFAFMEKGNTQNIPTGYYASYIPPAPDTVEIYEGGTSNFDVVNTPAGKEIISGDSLSVISVVRNRAEQVRSNAAREFPKTEATIIRSGFIPGQGFGSNRFRFAVRPGNFKIRKGAIISASVHTLHDENNIGTILCVVTAIDFQKNVFYVETSNELPKGENINWVIMNYPDY